MRRDSWLAKLQKSDSKDSADAVAADNCEHCSEHERVMWQMGEERER